VSFVVGVPLKIPLILKDNPNGGNPPDVLNEYGGVPSDGLIEETPQLSAVLSGLG